jgi:hypothetical protein
LGQESSGEHVNETGEQVSPRFCTLRLNSCWINIHVKPVSENCAKDVNIETYSLKARTMKPAEVVLDK